MRKVFILFILVLAVISSCKKEEENSDPKGDNGPVETHYAYIRGVVLDSITGLPVANAKIYDSDHPFSRGNGLPTDSTDVNGMFTRRIFWNVGNLYHNGTTQSTKPSDTADVYINAYASNSCRYIKFKGVLLIENDTITLPNIYLKPYAYISTHIKDTLPSSFGIYVNWYSVIGLSSIHYDNHHSTDTIIYHRACPGIEAKISWGLTTQSLIVNMGDTTFVNAFY